MAVEGRRGCGYRQCGGLYLCSDNVKFRHCGRLPLPCNEDFTRGFRIKKLGPLLAPSSAIECKRANCYTNCPTRWPVLDPEMEVGFMDVGEASYTPQNFIEEGVAMGVSKRINEIPDGLVFGKTFVFLAHRKAFEYNACQRCGEPRGRIVSKAVTGHEIPCRDDQPHEFMGHGIFTGFVPQRVECLVEDDRLDEPWVQKLRDRGVIIIEIPHNDPDHGCRPLDKPSKGDDSEQANRGKRTMRHRRSQRRES